MSLGRYYGTSDKSAVGWRTWVLDEEAGLLRSRTSGNVWTPGERFAATCEATHLTRGYYRISGGEQPPAASHAAPDRACECGVSAYKEPKFALLGAEVTGTVELSGIVIEQEEGFRASHARPLQLGVRSDGAADGYERAALIAKRLRSAYRVSVGVSTSEAVDNVFAQILREVPLPRGLASMGRIAWTARERHDRGEQREALKIVLAELRRRDLWEIYPASMAQALPAPFFLHETETRRWVRQIEGGLGRQRLTIASLKGQAPLYYGPQMVELDTRNGQIVERFEGCAGPRHHGHSLCPNAAKPDKLTISEISASLRLETWIQLLFWHANPDVRGHAAGLRRNP